MHEKFYTYIYVLILLKLVLYDQYAQGPLPIPPDRLVFSVASAPAIWQQAVDQILGGIPHVKCTLDDIRPTASC